MAEFSILPRFREFVLLFGAKSGENEIGPPQIRFRRHMANAYNSEHATYTGFGKFNALGCAELLLTAPECAYALRYVELNRRKESKPWSVRQTAVYHKYELDQLSSTWVLIAASGSAQLHLDRYVKSSDNLATLNPFEIHLILLDTALANWRPYIVDLTEKVAKQVRMWSSGIWRTSSSPSCSLIGSWLLL